MLNRESANMLLCIFIDKTCPQDFPAVLPFLHFFNFLLSTCQQLNIDISVIDRLSIELD